MVEQQEFRLRKDAVVKALASEQKDKSRKGGVDAPIADLIQLINSHPWFFSTSSCSGRVSIFLEQPSSAQLNSDPYQGESDGGGDARARTRTGVKKGGHWIYVNHEAADADEIALAVRRLYDEDDKQDGLLVFRFEPFILALECYSLAAAQQLVTCAMASGYRESGISSVGKRIIVAVRSSLRLEVPIGEKGHLIVPEEYLRYLSVLANKKFVLNQQRIDRFMSTFNNQFCKQIGRQLIEISSHSTMKTSESKSRGHGRRKGMSLQVQDKLLSSLETRQSNILMRISSLEACAGLGSSFTGEQRRTMSAGLAQSDMCSLFAARPRVSGGLHERLFRWGHSACATDEHSMIIFGGYGGPGRHERLNDILEVDIREGSVRSLKASGPSLPAMMAHTAAMVGESMIIVGGRRSPTHVLSMVCVLNLKTLEWSFPKVSGAHFHPRHRHASAVVGAKLYVHGGLHGLSVLQDLQVLDTASWAWSVIYCRGTLPSARHSHSLAAVGNKLFLFGGREGNAVYDDLYVLDLETCVWSSPVVEGIAPGRRFSLTMTVVMMRYVALIGGCPITKQAPDLVLLDVVDMRWIRVPLPWPTNSLLVRHTTTVVGNSLVVIGGGAACFAFGTNFSPTFLINLDLLSHYVKHLDGESRGRFELLKELTAGEGPGTGKAESGKNWAFKVERNKAKLSKDALKHLRWLDPSRRSRELDQATHVAFPILEEAVATLRRYCDCPQATVASTKDGDSVDDEPLAWLVAARGEILNLEMPVHGRAQSPQESLRRAVSALLEKNGLALSLLEEMPKRWERLGDMVVLPEGSLCGLPWSLLGEQLWRSVAFSLGASRLARQAAIAPTGTRDSQLQLLYGGDGWVQLRENGIIYCFDATKCMFSSGNVSEKLRIAKLRCQGATVVDLFAGIGYYVLPFLLKAGARKAFACEWNPHAVEALRHNLRVNGVEDICEVIEGDNRVTAPQEVADIVSLGLLPSSEGSWPAAVKALKPGGGILLVHGNVRDTEEKFWCDYVLMSLSTLAISQGRKWDISVIHFERVKWYAPHIRHVVADVRCRPVGDVF